MSVYISNCVWTLTLLYPKLKWQLSLTLWSAARIEKVRCKGTFHNEGESKSTFARAAGVSCSVLPPCSWCTVGYTYQLCAETKGQKSLSQVVTLYITSICHDRRGIFVSRQASLGQICSYMEKNWNQWCVIDCVCALRLNCAVSCAGQISA